MRQVKPNPSAGPLEEAGASRGSNGGIKMSAPASFWSPSCQALQNGIRSLQWRLGRTQNRPEPGDVELPVQQCGHVPENRRPFVFDIRSHRSHNTGHGIRAASAIETLPVELLREIFVFAVDHLGLEPIVLTAVCRHWRAIVAEIDTMWSKMRIGTRTVVDTVERVVHRSKNRSLIVELDLRGGVGDPSLLVEPLMALNFAIRSSLSRWQTLLIASLPREQWAGMDWRIDSASSRAFNHLESLEVAISCRQSPYLSSILDLVRGTASNRLKRLMLRSPFAAAHLVQQHTIRLYSLLTVFAVNGREIGQPVDILHHFVCLESLHLDHLPLSDRPVTEALPLSETIRYLRVEASSIQWMAGRWFNNLHTCAFILPR
jgi:hypothetical protein